MLLYVFLRDHLCFVYILKGLNSSMTLYAIMIMSFYGDFTHVINAVQGKDDIRSMFMCLLK